MLLHLPRVAKVGANYDGPNYLRDAVVFSHGDLARSRYSPGWGFLLTPLTWVTGRDLRVLHLVGALVVIAISVAALVLVYQFLGEHVSAWTAVALVAVLALGESATNALFGVEVEPLALLLVTATLVCLQRGRPWLAVVATGVAVVSRVAIVPFFAVLWLLWLRRRHAPSVVALAMVLVGVGVYLLTRPVLEGSYVELVYVREGSDAALPAAADVLTVLGDNIVRYPLRGLPAMLWPIAVLDTPLGSVLGLLTTAVVAAGAWQLVRQRPAGPGDVRRAAVVAGAAEIGLVLAWPATDSAAIRFLMPLAPLVLLAAAIGLHTVLAHLDVSLRARAGAAVVAAMLVAGVLVSVALTARQEGTDPRVDDLLTALESSRERLPEGAVLSFAPGMTEVATGRKAFSYPKRTGPPPVLERAQQVDACTVVIDGFNDVNNLPFRRWLTTRAGTVLAAEGKASVVALEIPGCSPSRTQ